MKALVGLNRFPLHRRDQAGKTPLDIAKELNYDGVVALLESEVRHEEEESEHEEEEEEEVELIIQLDPEEDGTE
jgi:NADPH-dependent glutamate synthase beta subunit-like oxidoreductase